MILNKNRETYIILSQTYVPKYTFQFITQLSQTFVPKYTLQFITPHMYK